MELLRVQLRVMAEMSGCFPGRMALVPSWVLVQAPSGSLYHYRYTGGVHLSSRKKWRVKAVDSPVHNLRYLQTVALGTIVPL